MSLSMHVDRARAAAQLLYAAFNTSGIHGRRDMPEDVVPKGPQCGSLEHLLFVTLTVSIDYQRDATALWADSRRTFEDSGTRYLYDPRALHEAPVSKIVSDMRKHGLSKYGCTRRDRLTGRCPMTSCEALEYCVPGCIRVGSQAGTVELDT